MKKQGIPEPLDESLVTRKRKDAPAPAEPERKKRSRTAAREAREAREAKAKAQPKTRVAGKPVKTAAAIVNGAKAKGKAAKAAPPPPSDSEDDLSEDDSDIMDDSDINVTGLDALGSASEDEESIDEDEFDSDVVDSDNDIRKGAAMWSEDEDDEDAEEKLTAANIAGLSRKLDEQKAIEEAEAQAELEENMQTNIAGERPKILEDEEDEEGRPITNLVNQDIQLLRTRLTDTIRVLDDFKNLAEEGRSRAEYRASLLKDICAYYGMPLTQEYYQPDCIQIDLT